MDQKVQHTLYVGAPKVCRVKASTKRRKRVCCSTLGLIVEKHCVSPIVLRTCTYSAFNCPVNTCVWPAECVDEDSHGVHICWTHVMFLEEAQGDLKSDWLVYVRWRLAAEAAILSVLSKARSVACSIWCTNLRADLQSGLKVTKTSGRTRAKVDSLKGHTLVEVFL